MHQHAITDSFIAARPMMGHLGPPTNGVGGPYSPQHTVCEHSAADGDGVFSGYDLCRLCARHTAQESSLDLLTRFIDLHDATPARISAFASEWGVQNCRGTAGG